MARGKVHTWGAVRQIQELNKWQTRTPDGNSLKIFFIRPQRVFFSGTLGIMLLPIEFFFRKLLQKYQAFIVL